MRSVTGEWYEVKISTTRFDEKGMMKEFKDSYVLVANTFTEAEAKINSEVSPEKVLEEKIAQFSEVFFNDKKRWYKIKAQFITLDERSGKEKRQNILYLVNGDDIDSAKALFVEVMGTTLLDYSVVSISETPILEVFE